ncbi:hypothetical protein Tsubulata_036596 [Turnera subulata]|uniref:DUF4283 domain-containing protein n=1 Tax=Turnera subulata TaxID=218843 RepID=A0A9Q0JDK7_9ROSI|nr:hypothetical protein Tsubulata_036596 [Turnera subulata]
MKWLDCCAFGILTCPLERQEVHDLFTSNGMPNVAVSEIEGETVLIHFHKPNDKQAFLSAILEWVEDHFQVLREWKQGDGAYNRKCWIQLKGVPLQTWCRKFFLSLSRRFGDLIKIAEATEQKVNMEYAFMELLTTAKSPISWEFNVDVKGQKQIVKCTEIHESYVQKIPIVVQNRSFKDLISLDSSSQTCSKKTDEEKASALSRRN